MNVHHERAINSLASRARGRGAWGLVVVGSVALGTARPDSDVDAYEVVDDHEFDERFECGAISWVESEGCDWPGGYCDLKLVSRSLLRAAAERGDDPMRASFERSRIIVDDAGDLPELVAAIVASPPERFERLAESFAAQFALHGNYFLRQAHERGDALLARSAAVHAATAAGRLVLARSKVLYRGPKYLREQLQSLPSISVDFVDALQALVEHPSMDTVRTVHDLASATGALPEMIDDDVLSRFIVENELSWFTGALPAEAR